MMALTAEDLRGLVLVRDCLGADGGFIVAHALKLGLGLDGGHSVLLVAARHTAPHYAMALRKAGVHLPQLVAAGRAAVVDAMRPAPGQAPAAQLTDLRALHRGMGKAAADLAQGQRPLLVVIDDLTVRLAPKRWLSRRRAVIYLDRSFDTLSGACTALPALPALLLRRRCTAQPTAWTSGPPSCTPPPPRTAAAAAAAAPWPWRTATWRTTRLGSPAWSTPPRWWWRCRRWRRDTRRRCGGG
jgi:hypothetical protein